MSKTRALQKLVRANLLQFKTEGVDEVYYRCADPGALYPHIVFDLSGADTNDDNRTDYDVTIDIYAKNQGEVYELADKIEDVFRSLNQPTDDILPTFHLISRSSIDEEDPEIKREFLRMTCQLYENE